MFLRARVFHLTKSSLGLMMIDPAASRQVGTREGQPGNGGDWFLIPRPPLRDRFYSPIPNCGRWECPIVPLDRNHESASNYRTSTAQSRTRRAKLAQHFKQSFAYHFCERIYILNELYFI